MSSAEKQLLSRIVRTGCLPQVLEWGIDPEDFKADENRITYQCLVRVYENETSKGCVVGPNELQRILPDYVLVDDPGMTLEGLCHNVRELRLASDCRVLIDEAQEELIVDPKKALLTLTTKLQELVELGDAKSTDVSFGKAMRDIRDEYYSVKNGEFKGVFEWPWQSLQNETMGLQVEDYVVLYGRPKSMKSFVLAFLVACAYLQGLRILVFTREMTPHNVLKRVAAFLGRLPYSNLRKGKLGKDEEELEMVFQMALGVADAGENLICLSGKDAKGTIGGTVTWLHTKIKKYRPQIVFVDGLYLLKTTGRFTADHQRVQSISREVRDMVLETGVPLIATAQANRQAAKHNRAELDEIAHSDAISQDATMAFRVMRDKTDEKLILATAGSREWKLDGLRIYGKPCYDFSEDKPMSDDELRSLQEQDDDEKLPQRKRKTTKKEDIPGAQPRPTKSARQRDSENIQRHLRMQ